MLSTGALANGQKEELPGLPGLFVRAVLIELSWLVPGGQAGAGGLLCRTGGPGSDISSSSANTLLIIPNYSSIIPRGIIRNYDQCQLIKLFPGFL